MTDYDQEYKNFQWKLPEYFNFAGDVIDKWAKDPEKLAMLWVNDNGDQKKRTFLDFSKASKKLANVLSGYGVKKDDLIVVILGRDIEWWEIFTASLRMGAVISPGTTQLTSKDIKYRVNTSEAVCFITDNANAAKFDAIEKECPTIKAKIVIGDKRDGWISYNEEVEKASENSKLPRPKLQIKLLCILHQEQQASPKWFFILILMDMHTQQQENTGLISDLTIFTGM